MTRQNETNEIKVGDTVKYREPDGATEETARFTVIDDRGDHVLTQWTNSGMAIAPTECVLKDDITKVEDVRASDEWVSGKEITKATFDKAVEVGQRMQKFNPYGSELHRKGHDIVRQACVRFFGEDKVGAY